jgi:hypothetical protein
MARVLKCDIMQSMVNWRDIQDRAEKFIFDYKDAKDEDRDAKSFWKDLMTLFGVEARSVGAFEERVKMYGRPGVGKIDYFAPRKFLIEQKSRGKDLDDAYKQALDYFDALSEDVKPRHIIVSDFARIRIYDLESKKEDKSVEFALEELPQRVAELAFFTDEEVRVYKPEEHIDVRAVRVIGKLHDALKVSNYKPEHLPPLLTRLVFCFFADDIGIFEKNAMRRYFEENTKMDGSDIGDKLRNIFDVLNTPDGSAGTKNERQAGMDDTLRGLPYVNGGMFAGHIDVIFGTRDIRDMLMKCMEFDWSAVSPAIFGSMFQSVMNEKERHDLGAHYTSETNILKVINGLFLEDLKHELDVAATSRAKLDALWDKISQITLLDPACGCGNFLVIAYRELRAIENEIIRRIHGKEDKRSAAHASIHGRLDLGEVDLQTISKFSVERMYGIEIDAFPAEIAKLSLWLIDHKMNMELGKIFGKPLRKLPLTEAPHIVQGNALRLDWESVVPKEKLTYILGNPPFLGYKQQNVEQKVDMEAVCCDIAGTGVLDYVAAWYLKAARLIQGTSISVAFVSTNSITQGEQVAALWKPMMESFGIKIVFAHRTFKWTNEATGKAAVYCVIVGFGLREANRARLYEYDDIRGEPREKVAKTINPYLVDGPTVFLEKRMRPISNGAPDMVYGNEPREGGMLLLDETERSKAISEYPQLEKWIRKFVSADDFLNDGIRYCYWLVGAEPEILKLPPVRERLTAVRVFRETSKQKAAHEAANTPALFVSIRQDDSPYLLIPVVSSENRKYIPIGYMESTVITSNANFMLPNATLWHFGIIESEMQMTWVRAVCGRLKSDYRYSNTIVYNNFSWPEEPTVAQKKAVEDAAQEVLDARATHEGATLAALYDPNTMPQDLLKAHHALDRAVDACYGKRSFKSEPERLEFLFERYKALDNQE